MITQQVYSFLALHVYATGVLSNKPILPTPWTEVLQPPGTNGFACAVYRNTVTNEVVISFRGTDNDLGDWASNLGLILSQEKQAAAVYANVLRDYGIDAQGSNISFTGHSLGGGLAATMAVWFDRPAVVFDPAPTEVAATNWVDVAKVLASMTGPVPQAFVDYLAAIGSQFDSREHNVTSYYAPGSIVFAGSTAGNTITGADQGNPVQFGNQYMGGADMHSQALLAAGLLCDPFRAATVTVQRALPIVMAKSLYALPTTGSNPNFILDVIRSEQTSVGNGKLTHFAADLNKLGTNLAGLNTAAQDAIIAQGVEWYYWQGSDYAGTEFITQTGALLQYTTAKGDGLAGAQNKAAPYLKLWLDGQLGTVHPSTLLTIVPGYNSYQQWNVSASTDGVTGTARDATKSQIFIGQAGADIFTGGGKNDLLAGGAGTDTYNFNGAYGKDTVLDSDGLGEIKIDGQTLGQAKATGKRNVWTAKLDDGQLVGLAFYDDSSSSTGKRLVITRAGNTDNTITVNNFDLAAAQGEGGYLGIKLESTPDLVVTASGNAAVAQGNPFEAWDFDPNTFVGDSTTTSSKSFTVYLNQAAKAGATLVLQLGELAGQGLKAILGEEEVSADGATITLAEGQTQASFAIVQGADIGADATGALTVSFQQDGEAAISNEWNLTWTADTQPANTLAGDDPQHTTNKDNLFGSANADLLQGLTDSDALLGLAGDDKLEGGLGGDVLQGGLGADTLNGGDGDDLIYGSSNGSAPTGYGSIVHPVIVAQGQDWIRTSSGETDVDGFIDGFMAGLDRDIQQGDAGNSIDGGTGDDVIRSGTGDDLVHGGDGKDDVYGMGGADVLLGDADGDRIYGDGPAYDESNPSVVYALPEQHGADFLDGGEGNDILLGQGNGDVVYGGAGDDNMWGDDRDPVNTPAAVEGNDYLDGEGGNDTLRGGGGDDQLYGGADNDQVWGDGSDGAASPAEFHGEDYLDGEGGDDALFGGGKNDVVYGGIGNDVLYGDDPLTDRTPEAFHGDDYLDGEEGNDRLVGGGKADSLFGGLGNDVLWGDGGGHVQGEAGYVDPDAHGGDYLDGEEGGDLLVGEGGKDTLYGGTGNDTLMGDGAALDASLHGDDYLDGEEGDDSLSGDGGDDTLFGGADADSLAGGEGNDHLDGEGGNDVIVGGAGDDVLLGSEGNDQLQGGAGNDQLDGGEGANVLYAGDGNDTLQGGSGNDSLLGEGGDDTLDGWGSADQLQGGDGNDLLVGGDGDDRLFGDAGNDTLDGGAGVNELQGGEGNDVLIGGDGGDTLFGQAGDDTLYGGAGSDVLVAGTGNDSLVGAGGNDTYHINSGAGHVTVSDDGNGRVVFGAGLALGVVAGGSTTADGQVVTFESGESVEVQGVISHYEFAGGEVFTSADMELAIEQAKLAHQTPLDPPPPANRIDGTIGNDSLVGGPPADFVYANSGDDTIDGAAGDDALFGEAGNDVIHAGAGADALTGGDGNDTAYGDSGADRIWGQAGDDLLYGGDGDDELTGGVGFDTLVGGHGDDLLTAGGTGTKTYRFDLGDGSDVVTLFNGTRHIEFSAGISLADIKMFLSPSGAQSYVRVQYSDDDSFIVQLGSATLDYRFSDGTLKTQSALAQVATQPDRALYEVFGTSGDDYLSSDGRAVQIEAGAGHDRLLGSDLGGVLNAGSGNDVLGGGAGADSLQGGIGNDALSGGAGSDIYIYRRGDGSDVITEDGEAADNDVLRFTDLNAADVAYTREAIGSLLIHVRNSVDTIEIVGWYGDSPTRLRRIEYADGTTLDAAVLENLVRPAIAGTDAADELSGSPYADEVSAGAGDDLIDGGGGNDILSGGAGSDTYLLYRGMGLDAIEETAGESGILKLTPGLTFEQLVFERQGSNLYVRFSDATDGVLLQDYFDGADGWVIVDSSSVQKTINQAILDSEQEAAPGAVEQLRQSWTVQAMTSLLQSYADDNTEAGNAFRYTSPYTLEVDYPYFARVTYGFSEAHHESDAAYFERLSEDTESLPGESFLVPQSVTRTSAACTLTVTGGEVILYDYGYLDGITGLPRRDSYTWQNIAWVRTATTITITGMTTISASTDSEVMEHIVGGPSANVINTWGLGTVDGGAGDDIIINSWESYYPPGQFLYGGAGNDAIFGFRNEDMLIGGEGDDYLAGGQGNDTYYLIAEEAGTKIIDEAATAWFLPELPNERAIWNEGDRYSVDTVEFGPGITLASLTISRGQYASPIDTGGGSAPDTRTYETLDFSWGENQTARVLLPNPATRYDSGENDGTGIEYFKFADGTVLSLSEIDALVSTGPRVQAQDVADQATAEDGAWRFTVPAFTSVEPAETLVYTVARGDGTALPSWLTFDPATRVFTGTPQNGDVGTFALQVTATDSTGAGASSTFALSIANVNDAPAVTLTIADQSANEDASWAFAVPESTFTDVDVGDTLTYGATLADGSALPSWLGFDAQTRTFVGTPANTDVGGVSVKVTATDAAGAEASTTFAISVANANDAPVVAQVLSGQNAVAAQAWTFTVPADIFNDEDVGDTLAYSAALVNGDVLPPWLSFDAGTRTFSGTAANANTGVLALQVVATDTAGASVSQSFELAVAPTRGLNLVGTAAADSLVGGAGDDRIDGLAGADTMSGFDGNDTYVVDNTKDAVAEAANQGYDRVESSVTYTLPAHVEAVMLTGVANVSATGNALDNELRGNTGNNRLDGGLGADALQGGPGNDAYIVDNGGDQVFELAGGGADTVQASVSYSLTANTENLILTGTASLTGTGNELNNTMTANAAGSVLWGLAGNDNLRGGAAADTLHGGDGNDILNGGLGADQLHGGNGNDRYLVDDTGDLVDELAGEGVDTVQSTISYVLGSNVENLALTGTAGGLNATGNDADNSITANSAGSALVGLGGNDTLRGGTGADLLAGGAGNDLYVVGAGDAVTELAGDGTDTVQSSVNYTLGAELENLTLTGADTLIGQGNELGNAMTANAVGAALWGLAGNDTLRGAAGPDLLYGGEGNDRLIGGADADQMIGGAGDDIYAVDNEADTAVEGANEGNDLVQSSVSFTLNANIENLTLTGTAAIDGTGNELDNVIVGNGAPNWLSGLAGNDTLNGGAANDTLEGGLGADRLNGGLGADTYRFGLADGADILTDVDATAGVQDVLQIGSGITADQLWLRKVSNNLEISIIGTGDKVVVAGWYSDTSHHIEVIELAGGQRLLDSQVQNLVQAMASFAPPAAGQTILPPDYQNALGGVIAANWQ